MKSSSVGKLIQLKDNLRNMEKVVVAFSGGVDSTFLLKVAHDELGNNVIAITGVSSAFSKKEKIDAKCFSEIIGVKHVYIDSEELDIDNYSNNPINRCYYCKKELFSKIKKYADEFNIKYVLDASNADDVFDYRPGFKALRELGIISPLRDVGLTKDEIRKFSKEMKLETWDKPAFACLASRFPYGIKITKKRLNMVEESEEFIRKLGIRQFRVRFHDEIARIEVLKKDFQKVLKNSDKISKRFKELGFKYITLDIDGYRTGSLNEVIKK